MTTNRDETTAATKVKRSKKIKRHLKRKNQLVIGNASHLPKRTLAHLMTHLMNDKKKLSRFIESIPGRISLALDMSSRSLGFVFIVGSFMDSKWKLHKYILNVITEPYLDCAVAMTLCDWKLKGKVFSVTVNQTSDFDDLRAIKNSVVINGGFFVGSCISSTINEIAKEIISATKNTIMKIRNSVKHVTTLDSSNEKFLQHKHQFQVSTERNLLLDSETQWNTTYDMLVSAYEMKEVFLCLDIYDSGYQEVEVPSVEDWKLVEIICESLKFLFDAANIFSTEAHPVAVFLQLWKIYYKVCQPSEDPFTSCLKKMMLKEIEKYFKDCCIVLGVGIAMDPRFKMKFVDFSFKIIYGKEAPTYIKMVNDELQALFHKYVEWTLPGEDLTEFEGELPPEFEGFEEYLKETEGPMLLELNRYLNAPLISTSERRFDPLKWWETCRISFPTISNMACDIFSISLSTLTSESTFTTRKKNMDEYYNSMHQKTVEAMICSKDWKAANIV